MTQKLESSLRWRAPSSALAFFPFWQPRFRCRKGLPEKLSPWKAGNGSTSTMLGFRGLTVRRERSEPGAGRRGLSPPERPKYLFRVSKTPVSSRTRTRIQGLKVGCTLKCSKIRDFLRFYSAGSRCSKRTIIFIRGGLRMEKVRQNRNHRFTRLIVDPLRLWLPGTTRLVERGSAPHPHTYPPAYGRVPLCAEWRRGSRPCPWICARMAPPRS